MISLYQSCRRLPWLALCVLTVVSPLGVAATYHVDAFSPVATNKGPGSSAVPFKTLEYAASLLQPGDTLIIGPGVYRESLVFPVRNWASGGLTTVQGDPDGKTILKGSRVMASWSRVSADRFVRTVDREPQQVHVNGVALIQAGGTVFGGFPERAGHELAAVLSTNGGIWPGRSKTNRDSMPEGSFHYDGATKSVMIRLKAGQVFPGIAEVSTAARVVSGSGLNNVLIRNLNVEHSSTTTGGRGGAVHLEGSSIQIDQVKVRFADGACISAIGDNITISGGSFTDCGQLGLLGRGKNWLISDTIFSRNNTRGFNKWWEAGGAKFVGDGGLRDSLLIRVAAIENSGDGIWFDWMNSGNRVSDSLAAFNSGTGIHTEVVEGTVIENNVVVGNLQRGIYHRQGSNNTIVFNFVSHNAMDGIAVIDEGQRIPGSSFDFSVRNNWIVGNMIAWNNPGLSVPAPLVDNLSNHNYFIGDAAATRVRIGWGSFMPRSAWRSAGLDTSSIWRDQTTSLRPQISPNTDLKAQLAWARTLRSVGGVLSDSMIDDLLLRDVGFLIRKDWRRGPDSTTWFGP